MSYYKKKLEGITTNNALLELWKDVYSKKVLQGNKNKNKSDSDDNDNDNDCKINMIGGPKNEVDAIEVLKKGGDPIKQKKIISIRIIQAIRIIFENENDKKKMELLDNALQQPQQQHAPHASTASKSTKKQKQQQLSLAYTSPPSKESSLESNPEGLTAERRKYLNRIEKLKLQSEETKYSKITTNIKDQRQEDDITAKSMTYAASVGINMIVAPISFGTFMYFFSGGVFDFFFPPNIDDDFNNSSGTKNLNPTGVDIKRVIIGVISGVIMMIIEMLLFVIRTHEFDHYATKKKRNAVLNHLVYIRQNQIKSILLIILILVKIILQVIITITKSNPLLIIVRIRRIRKVFFFFFLCEERKKERKKQKQPKEIKNSNHYYR